MQGDLNLSWATEFEDITLTFDDAGGKWVVLGGVLVG